ncbi:MAG: GlsB/YeaQ/YmgE family stress response membrane protein [Planctomycetia bacterium]|nr:GlsB/YeaQ/YmgE family stress response membrane protein [Planctomycetia bacterium]
MMTLVEQSLHDLLEWVGFGTLAGLAAKAVMPGKDPGGAVATLLMGIGGSAIGCGIMSLFWKGSRITPLSPLGFLLAAGGAFILLFFYRLLAGSYFSEAQDGWWRRWRRPRRMSRRMYVED